ncbi:hypothetical protein [uncultured Campylobacter sp.]|uniref:hypothetical protein n=1 Tax=uncultured Campylobacter sp. TaxID=218934 RepID=UPI00261439B0|nr:hypothetical protein [uncultured Campylobacter sp.]
MKNPEWLGKEIYRVERSKIFGHLRPYLSYAVLLLLVYTGWYRGDIIGISISFIIFFNAHNAIYRADVSKNYIL